MRRGNGLARTVQARSHGDSERRPSDEILHHIVIDAGMAMPMAAIEVGQRVLPMDGEALGWMHEFDGALSDGAAMRAQQLLLVAAVR